MGLEKPPILNKFKYVNWQRLAGMASLACGVWAFWAAVVPPRVHIVITAALGTISFVLGYMTRGTKFVENRQETQ